MQTQLNTKDLKRPFAALTPAQRWHVEVFGYVVVENVFDDNEVGLMLEALQKLKRDCYDREDPWSSEPVHNCTMYHSGGHLGVPMTFTFNGLYHCHFVKAITNLTELGPDDGGTCVIAGTHKVTCREEGIAEAARQDPSMIHQVVAPAGSTLLFCQTLLHATGDIRSDRDRSIIITGYIPHNGQYQGTFQPGFEEQVPDSLRKLIFGSHASTILHRRTLDMEVDSADPGFFTDGWSLSSNDPQTMEVGEMSWQGAAEFV